MSSPFCAYLQKVYERFEKIIMNLNEIHAKNIEFLNDKYYSTLDKLQGYRDNVNDIIFNFEHQSPNRFYQKIQDISEMDESELADEQSKWEFPEPRFKEIVDPYKLEEIMIFKLWQPVEVTACTHVNRDAIVTYCKKGHCKLCLKENIEKNHLFCMCETKLSPKNIHEIMGFQYKIEN